MRSIAAAGTSDRLTTDSAAFWSGAPASKHTTQVTITASRAPNRKGPAARGWLANDWALTDAARPQRLHTKRRAHGLRAGFLARGLGDRDVRCVTTPIRVPAFPIA